ncbi:hypothetical protein ACS0TY_023165 [Phlomoides rotata]
MCWNIERNKDFNFPILHQWHVMSWLFQLLLLLQNQLSLLVVVCSLSIKVICLLKNSNHWFALVIGCMILHLPISYITTLNNLFLFIFLIQLFNYCLLYVDDHCTSTTETTFSNIGSSSKIIRNNDNKLNGIKENINDEIIYTILKSD